MPVQPGPQTLRVFAVAQALEVAICFLLAHLAVGDGGLHVCACMPSADSTNRSIEFSGSFGCAEPCRFLLGDPPGSDDLVNLLNDAFLSYQLVASLDIPALVGSWSVSLWCLRDLACTG